MISLRVKEELVKMGGEEVCRVSVWAVGYQAIVPVGLDYAFNDCVE